ncbi:hypothetical protein T439DRAFT_326680 [Meredithblackwellia eburnea MCA 4105]
MQIVAPSSPPTQLADSSVFASKQRQVHDIPMSIINRPLPSQLEEAKVQQFMNDIQAGDTFTPIEVLRCIALDKKQYYMAFGGCHRFEAHKRLKSPTIPGVIIDVPPSSIRLHLGSSCPF